MRILQSIKTSVGWFYQVTPDHLINAGVPEPEVRAALAALLKAEIDAEAEAQRLLYITGGAGQALEYQEAAAQAAGALAQEEPKSADFPMLAASIGYDIDPSTGQPATDVKGVARSVNQAFAAFNQIGAAIRAVRLTAKAEFDAAGSIPALQAAREAVVWPTP